MKIEFPPKLISHHVSPATIQQPRVPRVPAHPVKVEDLRPDDPEPAEAVDGEEQDEGHHHQAAWYRVKCQRNYVEHSREETEFKCPFILYQCLEALKTRKSASMEGTFSEYCDREVLLPPSPVYPPSAAVSPRPVKLPCSWCQYHRLF